MTGWCGRPFVLSRSRYMLLKYSISWRKFWWTHCLACFRRWNIFGGLILTQLSAGIRPIRLTPLKKILGAFLLLFAAKNGQKLGLWAKIYSGHTSCLKELSKMKAKSNHFGSDTSQPIKHLLIKYGNNNNNNKKLKKEKKLFQRAKITFNKRLYGLSLP